MGISNVKYSRYITLEGLNTFDPVTRITACEFFCVWTTDLSILYRFCKG